MSQLITKKFTVYSFDELPSETQAKVLDKYRDWNTDSWSRNGWSEFVVSEWVDKLNELGFIDAEIHFSGFWSQGDGANFTCSIDLEKWLKNNKLCNKYRAFYSNIDTFSGSIYKTTNHYEHSNTVSCEIEGYSENDKANEQSYKLETEIIDNARDLMTQIYRDLEKEYDYLTSDDAIKESLTINEYLFTEDGTIYSV